MGGEWEGLPLEAEPWAEEAGLRAWELGGGASGGATWGVA